MTSFKSIGLRSSSMYSPGVLRKRFADWKFRELCNVNDRVALWIQVECRV
jgi:hypothetical protein